MLGKAWEGACSLDNQSKPSSASKPTFSPYQEGVKKALAEAGKQHTLEAIQNGVPPQHIEQQAGLSQQDILNQILSLSQSQVPAKSDAKGMMGQMAPNGVLGGLLNMAKGQSFNAPKMETLGINNAIQLQGALQSGQKNSMDAQKFPLEMENLKTQNAKGKTELRQMHPGFRVGQAKQEAQAKGSFLTANDLFTKFESAVQPFVIQRDAYARIKETGVNPSPAGDLALLYGYMKLLDPGSTVREGEFATAQNAGSIPQRIQAMYNKVASGKRLTPEQRGDFLERSKRIYGSAEAQYGKTRKEFTRLTIANKLDPNSVIRDLGIEETGKEGDTNDSQSTLKRLGLDPEKFELVQ